MFDLSVTKLLVLAVIALVVFGPKELPKIASQAGRALRDLRRIAEGAKQDLREGLGPEFEDFDFDDLNPRRFVQKHLLDEPVTTATAGEREQRGHRRCRQRRRPTAPMARAPRSRTARTRRSTSRPPERLPRQVAGGLPLARAEVKHPAREAAAAAGQRLGDLDELQRGGR